MVRLRPHHGLCIRHFRGMGYSEAFVENMSRVIEGLRGDPQQEILLCAGPDALCGACPHRRGGGCASGQKPVEYDERCLALCGLRVGESLSWAAFARRVEENIILPGRLEQVCRGCQWLALCK